MISRAHVRTGCHHIFSNRECTGFVSFKVLTNLRKLKLWSAMLQLAPQPTLRLIISLFHHPFTIALFLGHYFLSSGLLAFWSDLDVKFKLRGVWFLACSEIYLFTVFTGHGSTKRHSSESTGIDFSLCSCNCRPF